MATSPINETLRDTLLAALQNSTTPALLMGTFELTLAFYKAPGVSVKVVVTCHTDKTVELYKQMNKQLEQYRQVYRNTKPKTGLDYDIVKLEWLEDGSEEKIVLYSSGSTKHWKYLYKPYKPVAELASV